MNPLKIIAIAFSAYSVFPMPAFRWREGETRYALCALPLVGAAIALAFWLWSLVCMALSVGDVLFAAVALCLPIALSGGIHLDGFCDVSDALASHSSREKKLEILSDSHIGAFAAIKCCAHLILQFALYCELGAENAFPVALGFVLSRSLCALTASLLPKARKSGMLVSCVGTGQNRPTAIVSAVFLLACVPPLVFQSPPGGALALALCALWCLRYKSLTGKNFGGVTGDTAGYFLQICEQLIPAALIAGIMIERLLQC